ncbi:MAG TPA: hypothetical protein VJN18_26980 [Polyangiaceae bacterium]|nr:hypothetical protein [Polyangiaceae bacterium]
MDRRQRKLQEKRKKRELAKKRSRLDAERRPSEEQLWVRAGARAPFGPCFISSGWDDSASAQLVSLVVTRILDGGDLLPHVLLLDRTCLGVKNAMLLAPMTDDELSELVEQVGLPHSGMEDCHALLAQSMVFHAVEYAAKLGFAPNPDFREALLGPRPDELLTTPWASLERPLYVPGPDDNVALILLQLRKAVGENFELGGPGEGSLEDAFDDDAHEDALVNH